MATEVITTVGSAGRTYSTIAAWDTATKATSLVSADEVRIGEGYADSNFVEFVKFEATGGYTDSTRYRVLRAAAGEEYDPLVGGCKIQKSLTAGTAALVEMCEDYFLLQSFAVIMPSGNAGFGGDNAAIEINNISYVDNCFLRCVATLLGEHGHGIYCNSGGGHGSIIKNCIISGCDWHGVYRIDGNADFYNCVIHGNGDIGFNANTLGVVKNCISAGNTGNDWSAIGGTPSHLVSSDATAPGTHAILNEADTDLFENPAGLDFTLKAGSAAIDKGTFVLDVVPTDFDGNPHASNGYPDIGCYDEVGTHTGTLRLHAKFSEGTGTETANEEDGAQTGDLEGSTIPSWQGGYTPDGDASFLDFNGVEGGSIVVFPEAAPTMIAGALSVSAWVKTAQTFPGAPAADPQKEILTRGGGNFSLGWEEGAAENFVWLRCFLRDSGSVSMEAEWRDDNPQPGYRDDAWHHILIRFLPSNGPENGRFQLWVDGVLKDDEVNHDLEDLKVSGVEDWWVVGGRKNTGTSVIDRNLDASIDAVKVWDGYVSDATIAAEAVAAPVPVSTAKKIYSYYLKDD